MRNAVWQLFYDWQTLGAGILALGAGLGTIAVTRAAANGQIKVAQKQIEILQKAERRRIARESHAFAETLLASMKLVAEEVGEALRMAASVPDDSAASVPAYDVRHRITKSGFSDLRAALIRLGGELAEPLLQLDGQIDHYAAQCFPQSTGTNLARMGKHEGLRDELGRISKIAAWLADEAVKVKERCTEILMQDQD